MTCAVLLAWMVHAICVLPSVQSMGGLGVWKLCVAVKRDVIQGQTAAGVFSGWTYIGMVLRRFKYHSLELIEMTGWYSLIWSSMYNVLQSKATHAAKCWKNVCLDIDACIAVALPAFHCQQSLQLLDIIRKLSRRDIYKSQGRWAVPRGGDLRDTA